MISIPAHSTWVSEDVWSCLLNLMTTYFSFTTVDVFSEVDVTPIALQTNHALYVHDDFQFPRRPASVDLILIAKSVGSVDFEGLYGHTVVVTEDLNSTLPLWVESRLINTVVLMSNGSNVNAYTWSPYRRETCHQATTLDHIDVCSKKNHWSKNLYPNKVPPEFGGCPVIYKTKNAFPDVFVGPTNDTYSGREVTFMELIAESLNLTVHYDVLSSDFFLLDVTGDTAIGTIKRGQVDFVFASMHMHPDYAELVEPLPAFRENPLVWMIPRASPRDRVTGIYSGFPPEMWVRVGATITVSGLVVMALTHAENLPFRWIDMVAVLVAGPVEPPNSLVLQTFYLILQLYSLHIAWFYQALLLGNLCKTPMQKQMTEPSEIADAGLPVVMYTYMEWYFNHSDHEMWNKILSPKSKIPVYREWSKRVVEEKSAAMLGLLWRDGVALRRNYHKNLNSMVYTKPFLQNPVVAYGCRGSPLTYRFSAKTLHLIESGVLDHLTSLEKGFYDRPHKESNSVQVLELELLKGAFILLSILLSLSLIVFIAEILIKFAVAPCALWINSKLKIESLPARRSRLLSINLR